MRGCRPAVIQGGAMRGAFALLTVAAALGLARGEPGRRTATIDIDGVEIRAGQGFKFPAVGQLKKGDTVLVVREEENFLAILPPPDAVSWVRQIHLGKLEGSEGGKTNVPVTVEGAEVKAGTEKGPGSGVTTHLPKGSIVEVTGPAVRIDNASWLPITPPDGDLRWVPRNAIKGGSLAALPSPSPYVRPDTPPFSVAGGDKGSAPARPAAGNLPAPLKQHRLWARATEAEARGDYATARSQYALIYQDLWDQKAERDAIVICYNRYARCDEMVKRGDAGRKTESRREPPPATESTGPASSGAKWSKPGYLQELQKVYVDGQPVFALQDDGQNVMNYVTAVSGINLRNYAGKRVRLYGTVSTRPELYKPHLVAEQVEAAK
jgi:hypothetical protein